MSRVQRKTTKAKRAAKAPDDEPVARGDKERRVHEAADPKKGTDKKGADKKGADKKGTVKKGTDKKGTDKKGNDKERTKVKEAARAPAESVVDDDGSLSRGPFISRTAARALVQADAALETLGALGRQPIAARDAYDVAHHVAALALGFVRTMQSAISSGNLAGQKLAEGTLAGRDYYEVGVKALRSAPLTDRSPEAVAQYVVGQGEELDRTLQGLKHPWVEPLRESAELRLSDDFAAAVKLLQRELTFQSTVVEAALAPFPRIVVPADMRKPHGSTPERESDFICEHLDLVGRWLVVARDRLPLKDPNRDLSSFARMASKYAALCLPEDPVRYEAALDVSVKGELTIVLLGHPGGPIAIRGEEELADLSYCNNVSGIAPVPIICGLLDQLADRVHRAVTDAAERVASTTETAPAGGKRKKRSPV